MCVCQAADRHILIKGDKGDMLITNMQIRPGVLPSTSCNHGNLWDNFLFEAQLTGHTRWVLPYSLCVWARGPNQIWLPWHSNYFCSASLCWCTATVLHCLCNRSCLGYQGLGGLLRKRLRGNQRRELGSREGRVSASSEMFSKSGVDGEMSWERNQRDRRETLFINSYWRVRKIYGGDDNVL